MVRHRAGFMRSSGARDTANDKGKAMVRIQLLEFRSARVIGHRLSGSHGGV